MSNPADTTEGATAGRLAGLLPAVMEAWQARVTAEVSSTAKLTSAVLVGTFPLIFQHLVREVESGCAIPDGRTTLGNAHGRERALMTEHQPCDLTHEIHLFRDAVLRCAEQAGAGLTAEQRHAIRCTSDEIVRDSLQGYSSIYKRAQDQFSSAVSRDMRNLLNVIGVTGQMVQQKAADPSISSMAKRIIEKVAEADGLLQSAINPVSIKRNLKLRMTVTRVDLLPLIGDVAVEFDKAAGRIRIVGEPIQGYWSWSGMENAVRRLIAYSIQFGSEEGDIVIAARVEFERLILSVHNDSVFFPPEELSTALQTDYTYGAHMAEADGLPHVRHIAESHGGALIVQSGQASGTTLTLNIPLDARSYVES